MIADEMTAQEDACEKKCSEHAYRAKRGTAVQMAKALMQGQQDGTLHTKLWESNIVLANPSEYVSNIVKLQVSQQLSKALKVISYKKNIPLTELHGLVGDMRMTACMGKVKGGEWCKNPCPGDFFCKDHISLHNLHHAMHAWDDRGRMLPTEEMFQKAEEKARQLQQQLQHQQEEGSRAPKRRRNTEAAQDN